VTAFLAAVAGLLLLLCDLELLRARLVVARFRVEPPLRLEPRLDEPPLRLAALPVGRELRDPLLERVERDAVCVWAIDTPLSFDLPPFL